ncbi:thioredoxin family protein [Algoriphagus sp.]|uniref:thioredoxin family protein n=1 Tax=Algoriphagus sp. TaxID=1872435 RepID=UPI0026377703|nr:thioredoxin family protein [Algoriphagus sp.]
MQLNRISPDVVAQAMTYSEYKNLIDSLFAEGRTTGENQSASYLEYTRMAIQRMKRWDKTIRIDQQMTELVKKLPPQLWVIITEAWCGDAAQTIPYISKLAELNPTIQLRLILRDENPEIMNQYLTHGARSIPKLIALSPGLQQEYFVWGPKPSYLMEKQREFKTDPKGKTSKEFVEEVHLWYARDKNLTLGKELSHCFYQAFDL